MLRLLYLGRYSTKQSTQYCTYSLDNDSLNCDSIHCRQTRCSPIFIIEIANAAYRGSLLAEMLSRAGLMRLLDDARGFDAGDLQISQRLMVCLAGDEEGRMDVQTI